MTELICNDSFLREGAHVLNLYYGIEPLENAHEAAEATWESLFKITGRTLEAWAEVETWFGHPQVQANLAYYKAIGPWRLKQGLAAMPACMPGDEDMAMPDAAPESMALLMAERDDLWQEPEPEEQPLPRIIQLGAENYDEHAWIRLDAAWSKALVTSAQKCLHYQSDQNDEKLVLALVGAVNSFREDKRYAYQVYVKGVVNFSPPARRIINDWLKVARHRFAEPMYVRFRFD